MTVLLQTDRMALRHVTPADLDALVALDADAEVMHFITGGASTPRAEIEDDVLPHWLRLQREFPQLGLWAAESLADADFLGWFHLRPVPDRPDGDVELGYRLRRDVWGRGLATEGSRVLIEHAFRSAGATRVVAETMVVHAESRRVMEKAGMTLVRTFHADWPYRIPGDELGDVEYAITREEWMQSHAGQPRHVAPDFVVSAVVIRDEQGRVLVVRKRGTTRFMLPGGKIEAGETPAQAAIRELGEEVGAELDRASLVRLGEWTAPAANEPEHVVHGHIYLHPWLPGIAPRAEIDELLWLHPDDAADRTDLAPLFERCVLPALSSLES